MKIGVFGGTFDPVHNGHITVAHHACEYAGLHRIIFVPAWQAPHKSEGDHHSRAHHRLAMLKCVAEQHEAFGVSTVEIERGGTSYTADTLDTLHEQMPDAALYLIIGADNYQTFSAWRDPERIHRHATVLVHDRPGTENITVSPPFTRLPGACCDISSSMIRARVARGETIQHLVPECIATYIYTHNLYT